MLSIVYSEKFISQFEEQSLKIQKLALKRIEMFKIDHKHPSLKTHKLNGVLKDYFSFSVDYDHRIVFEFGEKGIVHFLKIGSHEVYR